VHGSGLQIVVLEPSLVMGLNTDPPGRLTLRRHRGRVVDAPKLLALLQRPKG
jgi:hypothetical protein